MKIMKKYITRQKAVYGAMALLITWLAMPQGLSALSVAEKATYKRNEMLTYLRAIRPMVYNFSCEPFPDCMTNKQQARDRLDKYFEIKRVYQQGIIYYYERNYINAYLRFLDAQRRVESLMESVSQSYVDRTEQMLRDALEQRDDNDPEKEKDTDMALVDVSIEFGPNSKLRRDFSWNREAPNETRRYNPRIVHYARNKYRIEKNMEMGYYHLGLAKEVRIRGLKIDASLPPHVKMGPAHRKKRIEYYIKSVRLCRLAKYNAEFIFQLKYPYSNYKLDDLPASTKRKKRELSEIADLTKVPKLENHKMVWLNNPYYLPKKLHPIFDLRMPSKYRRDSTDIRNMVWDDEVDMNIKFKFFKKKPTEVKDETPGKGGATDKKDDGN